jgi:hypothetical protein
MARIFSSGNVQLKTPSFVPARKRKKTGCGHSKGVSVQTIIVLNVRVFYNPAE